MRIWFFAAIVKTKKRRIRVGVNSLWHVPYYLTSKAIVQDNIFNRSNYFLSPTTFSLHFSFSIERRTETIQWPAFKGFERPITNEVSHHQLGSSLFFFSHLPLISLQFYLFFCCFIFSFFFKRRNYIVCYYDFVSRFLEFLITHHILSLPMHR